VFCVGVFCGRDLFTGVFAFLFVVFSYALFSYVHFTLFYVPVWYVASHHHVFQIIIYFLFWTTHHQLPSCLGQSVLMLCYNRWGRRGNRWNTQTTECVKIVSVYLSFQNNKIKVTVSNKCNDICQYISIMNLQSTA